MKMAELIIITDSKKVITVTKKAFDVIYKRHGFQEQKAEEINKEKIGEKKSKRTTKKKKSGEDN
jgi:hypothetical protein